MVGVPFIGWHRRFDVGADVLCVVQQPGWQSVEPRAALLTKWLGSVGEVVVVG